MTTVSENYRARSQTFCDHGHIQLELGDLAQASEKLWGAVAQAFKAEAEEQGWEHGSHAHFWTIRRRIADLLDDERILDWFRSAHQLHINFYEQELEEWEVRKLAADVDRLLVRLRDLR